MRFLRSSPILIWSLFSAGWLTVLFGGLALTRHVLELERAERQARLTAAIEESMRLSFWRLDTILSPLLSEPPHPLPDELVQVFDRGQFNGSVDAPIKLHFLEERDWSESEMKLIANAHDKFKRHTFTLIGGVQVMSQMNQVLPQSAMMTTQSNTGLANNEFLNRAQNFEPRNYLVPGTKQDAARQMKMGFNTPLFFNGELLLVSDVVSSDHEHTSAPRHIFRVDWNRLRADMKRAIEELLPEAEFEPIAIETEMETTDRLVSLPTKLIPGNNPGINLPRVSTVNWSGKLVALSLWSGLLTALIASGSLLNGLLRMNARRSRFVAAVTHELRTPLTTLKLYSELLEQGIIEDQSARQEYYATITQEVDRMSHLVENVFAFAKLEKGHKPSSMLRITIAEAFSHIHPRLIEMCERRGKTLRITDSEAWHDSVELQRTTFEQILVNFIDNACKYSDSEERPEIIVTVTKTQSHSVVSVKDHGTGFAKQNSLFRQIAPSSPFSKSVETAAERGPGIGLGLAISKGLAEAIGWKIETRNWGGGAEACILIPKIPNAR